MLKIANGDVVSITQIENAPGYDGHSLRALAYSEPDEMLDIKEALSKCGEGVKYFKRTNPDGSVDYFTEPA